MLAVVKVPASKAAITSFDFFNTNPFFCAILPVTAIASSRVLVAATYLASFAAIDAALAKSSTPPNKAVTIVLPTPSVIRIDSLIKESFRFSTFSVNVIVDLYPINNLTLCKDSIICSFLFIIFIFFI